MPTIDLEKFKIRGLPADAVLPKPEPGSKYYNDLTERLTTPKFIDLLESGEYALFRLHDVIDPFSREDIVARVIRSKILVAKCSPKFSWEFTVEDTDRFKDWIKSTRAKHDWFSKGEPVYLAINDFIGYKRDFGETLQVTDQGTFLHFLSWDGWSVY